ncbi:hypothetical protein RSAG8_04192, partial [Rhizoctonia solani AG-8 WAC10335]
MTEVFQRFATYRSHGTRSSVEVVSEGEPLLLNGQYRSADDPWAFLEQLAFAAMDLGRLDIADDCLVLLDQKFPDSPRVTVLKGQRLEADGMLQDALKMYVYFLTKEDENCVPIRKRLIATLRSLGRITETGVLPGGTETRAWLGVKLCLSKLPAGAKHPKLLEELATERILAAYSKTDGSAKPNDAGRAAILRWLGASQAAK